MIVASIIAAVASVATALIASHNSKRIAEVRILVDGRLDQVTDQLKNMTGRRDELQDRIDRDNGQEHVE